MDLIGSLLFIEGRDGKFGMTKLRYHNVVDAAIVCSDVEI